MSLIKGTTISFSELWILTFALYSPTLFAMKSSHECIAVPGWRWFAVYYRPLLQLIISGIVPDTTILIGNVAIIVKITRVKNQIRDTIAVRNSQDEPYNRVIGTCLGLGMFHLVTTLPVMTKLVIWGIRGCYTIEEVFFPYYPQVFISWLLLSMRGILFYIYYSPDRFEVPSKTSFHAFEMKKPYGYQYPAMIAGIVYILSSHFNTNIPLHVYLLW